MHHDTDIGGPADRFPETRASAVIAAGSSDPELRARAHHALISAYWKPVYKYLRIKWRASNEHAKDLTQGFFTRAMEKGVFEKYEPDKAAFRTYLRTCLDAYAANEHKAEHRLKRGGDRVVLSLDFESANAEFQRCDPPDPDSLDAYFEQEWVRSLFAQAVEATRQFCEGADKSVHFSLFERYDLDEHVADSKPTYESLANEFGLPVTQVTNYLAFVRRAFRRNVLELLQSITGSHEEYRAEARRLLGVDPA